LKIVTLYITERVMMRIIVRIVNNQIVNSANIFTSMTLKNW
jgi:hypothetical protein